MTNRLPTRINLTTTRRCNMKCAHCFVNHGKVPVNYGWEMAMDLFDKCMAQAVPLYENIGLSNLGEFLCDADFEERAKIFKYHMNRKPQICFDQVTNASLLDEDHLAPLAELKNPIQYVLSIDAVDPLIAYAIRPPGLSTRAQENIRNLNRTHERLGLQQPKFVIAVTLLKRNLLDCLNIVRFCREVGCSVYFRHAMGQGLELNQRESLFRVPAFSNRILKICREFGRSLGVHVSFEPLFAETPEEMEFYRKERDDSSISCDIFSQKYISKIDINGDYTCCYNLERIFGNIKTDSLLDLMNHGNIDHSLHGKPIPPCTRCRGRQRRLSFIHDPAVFDLDIPQNERSYDAHIDLDEHGFFDWVDEIEGKNVAHQIRKHWNTLFGITSRNKTIYASAKPTMTKLDDTAKQVKNTLSNENSINKPIQSHLQNSELQIKSQTWFHAIDFGNGIRTPGRFDSSTPPNWTLFGVFYLIENLVVKNAKCLDIGTMDGLVAIMLEAAGAAKVVATDILKRSTFPIVKAMAGSNVSYHPGLHINNLPGSAASDRYDLITCAGVLYQLYDPLAGISTCRKMLMPNGLLILETETSPGSDYMLRFSAAYDDYPEPYTYWQPTLPCLLEMLKFCCFQPLVSIRSHHRCTVLAMAVRPSEVESRNVRMKNTHQQNRGIGPYLDFNRLETERPMRSPIEYLGAKGRFEIDPKKFRTRLRYQPQWNG